MQRNFNDTLCHPEPVEGSPHVWHRPWSQHHHRCSTAGDPSTPLRSTRDDTKRGICYLLAFLLLTLAACDTSSSEADGTPNDQSKIQNPQSAIGWARDAVFYQIFPERFRNGDASNDPTRASIEFFENTPESWQVMPWTADWYERADWEKAIGDDFYEHGVFYRRYGGDLQGVIDKLDYLKTLGINTIYFNPVFYARSLHKYDGSSFHHIDPYFGPDPDGDLAMIAQENALDPEDWTWTAADRLFLDLLGEAHQRGIRVIIDGVFNHTGLTFFAFKDIQENQQDSPYADWYVINTWDDPATPENEFDHEGWWGYKPLPVFADTEDGTDLHPGPKQYVMDATARWMDPNGDGDPADGIDGWRLDVANEVPIAFWTEWNAYVREMNPAAYTVSEIWEDASRFIEVGGFSATMNYHGFAFPTKGFLIDNTITPSAFAEMLNERRAEYPDTVQYQLQNLIDSHDTDRLASMIVNAGKQEYLAPEKFDYDWGERVSPRRTDQYDVAAPDDRARRIQRLVALFQMTYVGAPMIYYGDEAGMWGADDPDDRMPMVWSDLTYAAQEADPLGRTRNPDSVAFDPDLYDYYRRAIQLRHDHKALRHGTFEVLTADDERNTLVFARTLGEEKVVVVLNRSDEAHSLRVPMEMGGKTFGVGFSTSGDSHRIQQDAEALLLEVPPLTGLVLRSEN